MTGTVLPQLEEVIADLTAQEEATAAQLAEIQAKREAVQSVILLFDEDAASAKEAPAATKSPSKASSSRASSSKASSKTSSRKASSGRAASATKTKVAKKPKAKTKGKRTKKDGRAASWQKYALEKVNDQPLPEAVRLILSTQPNKDFKIAEVMSSLFQEDMPKAQYLKARNRISNILSGGVRNGEWYKGGHGAYRLSSKGR